MLGGLFAVWPEALGIDLQENFLFGGVVNFAIIILGAIVGGYGAKIGDIWKEWIIKTNVYV